MVTEKKNSAILFKGQKIRANSDAWCRVVIVPTEVALTKAKLETERA